MAKTGVDFQLVRTPFSCIDSGPVDIFVANLVEIDQVVFSPTLNTDKCTFLGIGLLKTDISTKISTLSDHYTYILSLYCSRVYIPIYEKVKC